LIVSHRHRFIFLRTEKTGGTSLTRALWPHLGPDDLRTWKGRPWWARVSPIHHGALKLWAPDIFGLHAHATARQIRRIIGREAFDSYLKFTVERNPWDRQVSLYTHRAWKRGRGPEHFDRDMKSAWYRNTEYCRLNNWGIYAIDGAVVADRVLRYESLADDLAALLPELGIEGEIDMPRMRAYSPDRPHYAHFYSDETRALVARWYAREIAAFGYRFEALPAARTGGEPHAERGAA